MKSPVTSDSAVLVGDTVAGIIGSVRDPQTGADGGAFATRVWAALADAGLDHIGYSEELGGPGGSWIDAASAVRAAASWASAVPLAEAVFGTVPALGLVGAHLPAGLIAATGFAATNSLAATRTAQGWTVSGVAARVPFARHCGTVLLVARLDRAAGGGPALLALCPSTEANIAEHRNIAGEARDDVALEDVAVAEGSAWPLGGEELERLRRLAALGRAVQIAGAADQILKMTVRYATERCQFGRPIARFQAVAHQIAVMAGDVAVCAAAVDAAVAVVESSTDASTQALAIGCAKARSGDTADLVSRVAHQVFGALGFTQEHQLHHLTRRLWSWRDECGSAQQWQRALGEQVFAAGADGLWPLVTGTVGR